MVSGTAIRVAVVALAAAILASCSSSPPGNQSSKEYFPESVYGRASPRVVAAGQPVPKGGGRVVLGEPYRVAGKTYIPRDDRSYSATGLASWYGSAFHGRLTANGEVYDVNGLTAAHPTMPLPSYARVTNTANGRSLIVRVNDRGPFARNRVIDLSARAAEMLGYKAAGTARVRVDYMGPADMDGLDHNKLMASYREGGSGGLFGGVMLAAASVPRLRPPSGIAYQPAPAGGDPILLMPAGAVAGDDPLGPLIMRSGFASGYAAVQPLTPAQSAAEAMARAEPSVDNLQSALDRAARRKAQELAAGALPAARVVVQVGTFGDPDNALRATEAFARFGQVEWLRTKSGGRTLVAVRIVVDPSMTPNEVIAAAVNAGLPGAFVVR